MIQNKTILSVKIGERVYELYLSPESPIGEVHDALQQMKAYVVNRIVEEQKKENPEQDCDECK